MASEEKIVVVIEEDGSISAEGFGFEGATCLDQIESVLDGLGNTISSKKKDDFFHSATVRGKQKTQRGGS